MNPVDVKATEEVGGMRRDGASRVACQPQAAFVVVETFRVARDARELQQPLRPIVVGWKDVEGVPAQRIALAKRQKPARIGRNAELPCRSEEDWGTGLLRRYRDHRRGP
jgi:hypothetical protein